jgi:hypothetical protein
MEIRGRDLKLIHDALVGAMNDCNFQIGNCPDVIQYAEDIAELEAERDEYEAMLKRVTRALELAALYRAGVYPVTQVQEAPADHPPRLRLV